MRNTIWLDCINDSSQQTESFDPPERHSKTLHFELNLMDTELLFIQWMIHLLFEAKPIVPFSDYENSHEILSAL